MILGYKSFNRNFTNRYGLKFSVGMTYKACGEIRFGVLGNGFHMCSNMEDTFRYFDSFSDDIVVCEVIGSGENITYNDEYNGYYDMYAVETLTIVRKLEREEIIKIGQQMTEYRVIRFVQGFKMTLEEIKLFEDKFSNNQNVLDAIAYYQKGQLDVYNYSPKKLVRKKNEE